MSWLSDLFSPPAAQVPTPQISGYQPTGMAGAESSLLGGIGNLGSYNAYSQLYPQFSSIGQGIVNDPNAASFQAGAGTASGLGQNAALGSYGQGAGLYDLAGMITGTAFDPQSSLYNQQLQQTQDQQRAANSAAGVGTTPYGAGLEGQALNNFNINWQNNLLNRQVAGAGAAGSLIGQGSQLQGAASPAFYTASGLPYTTSQGIGQGQLGTLSNVGQFGASGATIPQQQNADWQNYLGWGTGQQGVNNQGQLGLGQFGLNQANSAFNQQQTMFGNLGQLAGLGLAFL